MESNIGIQAAQRLRITLNLRELKQRFPFQSLSKKSEWLKIARPGKI
jgi:hypothetical protein